MEILKGTYEFIIGRILERAFDSVEETHQIGDDFFKGRKIAYYEIADIIKTELQVVDADIAKFGLDVDLEKLFL